MVVLSSMKSDLMMMRGRLKTLYKVADKILRRRRRTGNGKVRNVSLPQTWWYLSRRTVIQHRG